MANKRQKKKRLKKISEDVYMYQEELINRNISHPKNKRPKVKADKSWVSVDKWTAVNTAIRDLTYLKSIIPKNQRLTQADLYAKSFNRIIRNSGLGRQDRFTKGIETFGQALQSKGILQSKQQKMSKAEKIIRKEAIQNLRKANMSDEQLEAHIAAREMKITMLKQTTDSILAYYDQLIASGQKIPEQSLRRTTDLLAEMQIAQDEVENLKQYRDYKNEYERILAETEFQAQPGEMGGAEYWAAIKRYNELLKKGMVPALNGLDKYETAEWAMDYLPFDEVQDILKMADEKAAQISAKAYQASLQANKEALEMQQLAKQFRLM